MANKIETRCRVLRDGRTCNAPIYLNHDKCENGHPEPQHQIDELREEMVDQNLVTSVKGNRKRLPNVLR